MSAGTAVGSTIERVADRFDVVVADVAVLDGGGQLRQFGRQHGSGEGAAGPDAGGDAHPAADVGGGDAQPLPQQLGHDGAGGQVGVVGPVGRFGELAEDPVHLPAIHPVLSLQPVGHLDAKRVAHRVRAGGTQPGVTRLHRIQCGADLVLLRAHATNVSNVHVRIAAELRHALTHSEMRAKGPEIRLRCLTRNARVRRACLIGQQ